MVFQSNLGCLAFSRFAGVNLHGKKKISFVCFCPVLLGWFLSPDTSFQSRRWSCVKTISKGTTLRRNCCELDSRRRVRLLGSILHLFSSVYTTLNVESLRPLGSFQTDGEDEAFCFPYVEFSPSGRGGWTRGGLQRRDLL